MAKKLSTAEKIRRRLADNPETSAGAIAKALGIPPARVYTVMYQMRKAEGQAPKKRGRKPKAEQWKIVATTTSDTPVSAHEHYASAAVPVPEPAVEAVDLVNNPPHYTVGGIETIDFIEAKKLSYNIGNAVKYLARCEYKGNRKQDLEKALWYINRELSKSVQA